MSSPRPRRRQALAAAATGAALAVAVLPVLTGAPASAEETAPGVTITPDPSYQHPEFEGWGTSLVWMANATGGYPEEIREQLAEMVFGDEGLNLNIARYNIGGGNAPNIDSEYMKDGANMPYFWAAPEGITHEDKDWWDPENPDHWNLDADANQRWWVDRISEEVTHWEAFSNSPPYFQTVSGYVSGGFDSSQDQIRTDTVDEFAIYLTTVMEHLEAEHGIEFDTVNPLNEPNTPYWGTTLGPDGVQPTGGRQEGAHAGPELQQLVIQALAAELSDSELDAVISAMDETNPGTFTTNWNAYSEETRAVVDQMNVHTYGTGGRTGVRDLAKGGDKPLWMSEVGGSFHSPTDYETMATGLGIADRITDDLRELEPSAWVFWQPIEDSIPQQEGGGNWGSIHIPFNCTAEDTLETCPIQTNTKYDTIRNFTHYIEPGDHMIGVDDTDTVAAVPGSGEGATVVYTNHSQDSTDITLDLSKFGRVGWGAKVTPITTSADGALVEGDPVWVNPWSKTADLSVPGESVTTFVVEGVRGIAHDAALVQEDHVYRLNGVQSDKALTPEGDGLVIRTQDAAAADQLWTIEKLTEGVSNRERYEVVNAGTGQRLAMDGDDLIVEDASGDPDESAQWIMSTTGNGDWTFVNAATGRLPDVWGQSTEDGATVGTYTPTAGSNQLWTVVDETVQGIERTEGYTVTGTAPQLPETVTPVYLDGARGELPVEWDVPGEGKWKWPGKLVKVNGTATDALGNEFHAVAWVAVDDFSQTAPASAVTYPGFTPELPETVTAIGDHGFEASVPVAWEEPPEGAFDDFGTVTLEGTATLVDGTELPATVEVEVTDPIEVNAATGDGVTLGATFTEPGYSTEGLVNGVLDDKAWSNWVSGDKRTEDTITVTLPEERDVTRVVSYFWSDGGRPSYADTLQVQYLDADGQWQNAGEPVDVPPDTDTVPVIDVEVDAATSAVRVAMTADSDDVAGWIILSEIEVYAKAPAA